LIASHVTAAEETPLIDEAAGCGADRRRRKKKRRKNNNCPCSKVKCVAAPEANNFGVKKRHGSLKGIDTTPDASVQAVEVCGSFARQLPLLLNNLYDTPDQRMIPAMKHQTMYPLALSHPNLR